MKHLVKLKMSPKQFFMKIDILRGFKNLRVFTIN
jgi:hypothetical protein